MCKYCNKKIGEKIKDIDNTENNYAKISFLNPPMLNVVLEGEDKDGYRPEDFFEINYCPMCGRKLNTKLLQATAVAGIEAGTPASAEVKAPAINDFSQEIAKAITEAIDPTNIANNISKNIMRGGM